MRCRPWCRLLGVLACGLLAPTLQAQAELEQRLRWALEHRDLLRGPERHAEIDALLAELDHRLAAAPVDPGLLSLRMGALNARGRYAESLATHERLRQTGAVLPPQAQLHAAQAWQGRGRPDLALPLYAQALHGSATPGQVLALADSGRLAEAEQALQRLPERQPENALLRAWLEHLDGRDMQADARLRALREQLPFSDPVRSAQANVLLARGRPEAAQALYQEVLSDHPDSIGGHAGYALAQAASGRPREADSLIREMQRDYPEDAAVIHAARVLRAGRAALLRTEASYADEAPQLARHEYRAELRVDSPLLDHRWRLFAEQFHGEADTDMGHERRSRSGLGLGWSLERLALEAQLHRADEGPRRDGGALRLRYRVGDDWHLQADWDRNSHATPWKALASDIAASAWGLALAHGADAAPRQVQLRWQRLDYSDGNDRDALALQARQRWRAAGRRDFEIGAGLETVRNSRDARPYFAPESETSAWLAGGAGRELWQRGTLGWRHGLQARLGGHRQHDEGSGLLWELRYEQQWRLGEAALLRYGIGQQVQPWDGEGERRRRAYVALAWPFD